MKKIILLFALCTSLTACAQLPIQQITNDTLPYYEIPDYPEEYNACTVTARLIDGLGFRYYWATDDLHQDDLDYKPNEEARTAMETLDHIYGLSKVVLNALQQKPNIRSEEEIERTYKEIRTATLTNLKKASDILRAANPDDIENFKIIFQRGESTSEYPFWHQLNGPIADALWHTGQIVSFRRASGNPFNFKASVFSGKVKE